MKSKTRYMTLFALAAYSSVAAYGQNQAKMQALFDQVSVQEPQDYTNAQQMLQDSGIQPEALDYTQFDGSITLGGSDGDGAFFIESHNSVAADTISTDEVRATGVLRLGLTGAGTTFGMWEVSDPLLTHPEFTNGAAAVRVIDRDGPNTAGATPTADRWHATHVAGTMVARGANALATGMSPQATLNAYDVDRQFTDITGAFSNADTTDDIPVSNHSYGRVAGWWTTYLHTNGVTYPVWSGNAAISTVEDYHFGFYDTNARQIDQIAYLQETYLPVWSAGNDRLQANAVTAGTFYVGYVGEVGAVPPVFISGTYPAPDGVPAGFDTMASYGVAKNVLTVAAANDVVGGWTNAAGVAFANFSSAGPTDDGRIKPDVTANGVGVLSADDPTTSPFNTTQPYFAYNGTSQAAPNVTGSINLLLQYHRQLYQTAVLPWASTVKAWIIHTADEIGAAAGPDYRGGWGLMNTMRAASFIRANREALGSPLIQQAQATTGVTNTRTVIAIGGQPIRVTVVWTDPAGVVGAAALDNNTQRLTNDLDVRVTGPGAVITLPYVLDPANPANAAALGDNASDNVEQVVVTTPTAGSTYTITVAPSVGENLVDETGAAATQPYAILISGIRVEHTEATIPLLLTSTSATTYDLNWAPLPGVNYDFETSTDLSAWVKLQTNQTFALTPAFTSVTRNPSEPKRFWRYIAKP